MNTYFALLAVHNSPAVPLDKVAEMYLNLEPGTARRQAAAHELPFPAFRAGDTSKSQWMVSLKDFSEFLDARAEAARETHRKVNS